MAIVLIILLILSLIGFAIGLKEDAEGNYSDPPRTIFEWGKKKDSDK